MKKLKNSLIVYFLFLIALGSCCINPSEKEGSCTKCKGSQILQKGFCYQKIRGCLVQVALKCESCQNGYVLDKSSCIRYAEYYNITNLAPAPITIDQQKLNPNQIKSLIVGGFQQTKNFSNNLYIAAKKKLIDDYPILQNLTIYRTEQQIVNGMNFIFYVINTKDFALYLAKVYVNFKLESQVTEIYKNQISIKKNPALSEVFIIDWEIFTNYQDKNYIQAKAYLLNSISGLSKYNIKKVQSQKVAGTIFLFEMTSSQSENNLFVKVYTPFYGRNQILGLWESPKSLTQKPKQFNSSNLSNLKSNLSNSSNNQYQYKKDPIFNDLYNYFKSQVKVVNFPAISKVEKNKPQKSDYWVYKIIYNSEEYAIVNFYPNYSIFEAVSYIVGNTQIFSLEKSAKKVSERSQQILGQRIRLEDSIRFSNFLVRQITLLKISAYINIYELHLYNTQGNFNVSILDRRQLSVIKIKKISDDICFQIDTQNPNQKNSQQSTIQQIRIILLSKFPFTGYQLTSAFVRVLKTDSIQYALLWSRIDLRKIRVSLEISEKGITVKKISFINDGTYVLKQENTQAIEALARKQIPELKDFQKVQTVTNGSLFKIYFMNTTHIFTFTRNVVRDSSTLESNLLGSFVDCKSIVKDTFLINFKGKCYKEIENCGAQIGNICSICDQRSIQINRRCTRDCKQIFIDF